MSTVVKAFNSQCYYSMNLFAIVLFKEPEDVIATVQLLKK